MSKPLTKRIISETKISKDVIPLILDYYYDSEDVKKFHKELLCEYNEKVSSPTYYPYAVIKLEDYTYSSIVSYTYRKKLAYREQNDRNSIFNFMSGEKTPLPDNYWHQKLYP